MCRAGLCREANRAHPVAGRVARGVGVTLLPMDIEAWKPWWQWWHDVGERELRALTMNRWDPIGVRNAPQAAREYDRYLGQIVSLLREAQAPRKSLSTSRGLLPNEWTSIHGRIQT